MRYYDFSNPVQQRPSRRRHKKSRKIILFALLAFVIMPILIAQYFFHNDLFSSQPETLALTTKIAAKPTSIPIASEALGNVVKKSLEGSTGKYSVVIKNLKTNEYYDSNEHQSYLSASLYKLWVMAVAYNQLQVGTLKEDEILSQDVTALNDKFDIASESAELHDGTVTFPVNQALGQMITISHNYAALLLAQKVKLSTIESFLQAYEYKESHVGQPPKTTAHDVALFYEDLYNGNLADPQHTQQMIELLKRQKLNNKLPKYLPDDAIIAHKTGELGMVTHDAGIVYLPQGDYVIVILSESANPAAAEERISGLSRDVYQYFTK